MDFLGAFDICRYMTFLPAKLMLLSKEGVGRRRGRGRNDTCLGRRLEKWDVGTPNMLRNKTSSSFHTLFTRDGDHRLLLFMKCWYTLTHFTHFV